VADERCSIDPCDEVERVEQLFCPAGEFVAVEQICDRALDRRDANVEPHAVNHHHPVLQVSISSGEAAARLDEAAREAGGFEHTWLTRRNHLDLIPLRIGGAMQLQRRVIGDDSAPA
jgi:hypothetical protein